MNKNYLIRNIVKTVLSGLSAIYLVYSFLGTFFRLPNLGEINSTGEMFLGFMVFVIIVCWHFLGYEH